VAHFRLNSVAVRPGQTVKAGDPLGVCGNSGNSDLPHVHYHLQTGAASLQGFGLPIRFKNYFAGGRLIEAGEPVRGDLVQPAAGRPAS
jgi:murein DD-endopeptidase MepM/ murein hydrolase activator NlpD